MNALAKLGRSHTTRRLAQAVGKQQNEEQAALAQLSRIRTALDRAPDVKAALKINNLAGTARDLAKKARLSRDVQNEAAEVALLAQRKAGEFLKALKKHPPQSAAKAGGDSEYGKVLRETQTPESTAKYWQKLARVSDSLTYRYFKQARKEEREITAAGLLREANKKARVAAAATDDPMERKRAAEDGMVGVWPVEVVESFVKVKDLKSRFGADPFSTLDLRQSKWSERKRAWEELGIKGVAGRSNKLVFDTNLGHENGTSEFHPALTETLYEWFAPKGGHILDPFAGYSTRGIVAAVKGYKYTGIDLDASVLEKNRHQVDEIRRKGTIQLPSDFGRGNPTWIEGNSTVELSNIVAGQEFDLIFTCPPYGDLERYSEDPDDLSTCDYGEFIKRYEAVFRQAVQHLKRNRFAVAVVAEFRDQKTGWYHNFVGDTVSCFQRLGLHFYNEIILLDPLITTAQRVAGQFEPYRKVGKAHQNVLVFFNGDDWKKIPEELGVLKEVGSLGAERLTYLVPHDEHRKAQPPQAGNGRGATEAPQSVEESPLFKT